MSLKQSWHPRSIAITLGALGTMLLFDAFVTISLAALRPIMWMSGTISLVSLFVASRVTVYNHRFAKHPSSFIAQTFVNNQSNAKAGTVFLGFVIFLAVISFCMGYMFSTHYGHLKYTGLLAALFYGAACCVVWMGSVQIDISRWGHLVGVLGMFVFYLTGNICQLVLLAKLGGNGVSFSPIYYIFVSWEIATSAVYMTTYFYDLNHKPSFWLQPGLHQKFWIISYVVSMMAFGALLSNMSFLSATQTMPQS